MDELVSGYRERMRRLALMDALVELERKQKIKDEQGMQVDLRNFGMLTLLFFFERRLAREYKTGIIELAQFLEEMTRDVYQFQPARLQKLAEMLVQNFRPANGVKRAYQFMNWETKTEEVITYSILKDNGFDVATKRQFYTLDDEGLELLFATKEFYGEFQISINQLMLKQQIKKGEFQGALRQIREMELEVDTLKERMEQTRLEILRSIISEETFVRYRETIQDALLRFEREDEEFKALNQFVKETRDAVYAGEMGETERRSYKLITKIVRELEAVHYEHARLLELTTELRTVALDTARDSLYYTGIQSFNFDQDIVSTILAKPYSPEKMRGVVQPFLRVEENRVWSPLSLFFKQSILEERTVAEAEKFSEADGAYLDEQYKEDLAEKYRGVMALFLQGFQVGRADSLRCFTEYVAEAEPVLLEEEYFYRFWLAMHQLSPVTTEESEDSDAQTAFKYVRQLLVGKRFTVIERSDVLHFKAKYSVQNMDFNVEELGDAY